MPVLLRKRKKNESLLKYIFGISHLWLGLLSSIVVFLVCCTGALLVFEGPIKDLVNRDVRVVNPVGNRLALDELQTIYREAYELPASRITVSEDPEIAVHFFAFNRSTGERVSVYIDPYTGQIKGQEDEGVQQFFTTMLRLHRWLLVRTPGKAIVGAATLMFIYLLLSGLILWWPTRKKQLKQSLTIKRKARFYRLNYDLHNVLGFYAMLGLLFLSVTGLFFSYPWVRDGLKLMTGESLVQVTSPQRSTVLTVKGDRGDKGNRGDKSDRGDKGDRGDKVDKGKGAKVSPAKTFSLDKGLAATQKALPYPADVAISMPGNREKGYTFRKLNTANILGMYLPDKVIFNAKTGQADVQPYTSLSGYDKIRSIIKPLHTGEIMGWPSMVFYFLLCLVGSSLPVTGFIIWFKAKRKSAIPRSISERKAA